MTATVLPESCTGTVQGLNEHGEGLVNLNGQCYCIRGALPGERITFAPGLPYTPHARFSPGRLLSVEKAHPRRNLSPCPLGERCGGCPLYSFDYDAQLQFKFGRLKEALEKVLRHTSAPPVEVQLRPAPQVQGSRHKSIRYFAKGTEGKAELGFYAPLSHTLCPVDCCPQETAAVNAFALSLLRLCQEHALEAYDERSGLGILRHLLIRDNGTGTLVAQLGLTAPPPRSFAQELSRLGAEHQVAACYLCINEEPGNSVLKGTLRCLGPQDHAVFTLLSHEFFLKPHTFTQVNPQVAELLYREALEHAGSNPEGSAWDLCCGIGTMTLPLARRFGEVTGVELAAPSVHAARNNAILNGIDNVSFVCAALAAFRPQPVSAPAAVIADPPRKGLGDEGLQLLRALAPGTRVSAIYCEQKALLRELPPLLESGFELQGISAFDMFPYTVKLEVLLKLLKRR